MPHCIYCDREISKALVSAHYRYRHKNGDLGRVPPRRIREQEPVEVRPIQQPNRIQSAISPPIQRPNRIQSAISPPIQPINRIEPRTRRRIRVQPRVTLNPLRTANQIVSIIQQEPIRSPRERIEQRLDSPRNRNVTVDTNETPNECIICLEDHDTTIIPCNHTSTCAPCLGRWWRESYYHPRCPMCRTETNDVRRQGRSTTIVRDWIHWRRAHIARARRRQRMPLNWVNV